MNVLVIGSGGREHVIVWKVAQSPHVTKLYCAPGNAGTAAIAENVAINAMDFAGLAAFAINNAIDLTIVGPDDPVAAGIVDMFEAEGLTVLGPRKYAAQLESSKSFAKEFMQRYDIPTAAYKKFTREQADLALAYINDAPLPIVIKADGLAAGKGVLICQTRDEARTAIQEIFVNDKFGGAGNTIVVEEFMQGEEVSVFALCDGSRYVTFAPAQDHKRIGDGDTGKNTGGMGTFAPARIIDDKSLARIKKEIIEPVLAGMQKDGCPYTGFLYCGLMMTVDGPKVVEFNCRFGDPEAQVVLPLIDYDFSELCMSAAKKNLVINNTANSAPQKDATAVCVVLASNGYPDAYETGKEISGLEKFSHDGDIVAFHAGTKIVDGKVVTSGGRVLGVTAICEKKSLQATIDRAYEGVGQISFKGMYYRHDIGQKGLKYEQ